MNPVLNLQSLDPAAFPKFRRLATEGVLASAELRGVFQALLGKDPKIVQSMYFEGNSATWEHQDTYYLDSEVPGEMAAAWIALEDIRAKAGRFFISPKSHQIELAEQGLSNNIVDHHEDYILSVVEEMRQRRLEIRAPFLHKGDVLFWHSRTIHGSLDSQDMQAPRSSVTCHAIPKGRRLMQLQTRLLPMEGDDIGGTEVCRPKDLAKPVNRLIFEVETRFPKAFHFVKRSSIRLLVRMKG
jgi:phytanoyl-CoA hydroxylase